MPEPTKIGIIICDRFDNIASAGLTFGSNHGCSLTNAAQGFTQVTAATDKGNLKVMLPDMMAFISRGKYLRFINVIYTEGFQCLGFNKVSYAALSHYRYRNCFHNGFNDRWVSHPSDTTGSPDISRYPLQCHHGTGTSLFGNLGVFGGDHIHKQAGRGLWVTPTIPPPIRVENVQITYIFYDGLVYRVESDEYVEITNLGDQPQDLAGWLLIDISEGYPSFTFPPYILAPSKSIRVYTNEYHP
ncbi:unnamed protein product, partial [marine sediment metagenome]